MLAIIISGIILATTIGVVYGSVFAKDTNKIKEYFWGTEDDYM